jgi:hypothetical protein
MPTCYVPTKYHAKSEVIKTGKRMNRIAIIAVSMFLCNISLADDYQLDPAPAYSQGSAHILESFRSPSDPNSCVNFLTNIRRFAKLKTPMSCETPIGNDLNGQVKKIEWTDLDPIQYADLFKALVARDTFKEEIAVKDEEIASQRDLVNSRQYIFRRAKLELVGKPDFDGATRPAISVQFYIVQYGNNVDVDSPLPWQVCKPKRGGPDIDSARFYLVTSDLNRVYGGLYSMADGGYFQDLILINNQPYVEEREPNGDRHNIMH